MSKKIWLVSLVITLLGVLLLGSLPFFRRTNPKENKQFIAKVGNKYLYEKDLPFERGTLNEEEMLKNRRFIKTWVFNNLMLLKLKKKAAQFEKDVEEKIDEYRNALILHKFYQENIDKHFNGKVTEKEIEDYYQNHLNDFLLQKEVLKGYYIVFDKKSQQILRKLEKLLIVNTPEAWKQVKEICKEHAIKYHLDRDQWISIDEAPECYFNNLRDYNRHFRKSIQYTKKVDTQQIYYLFIIDCKETGEVAPLELAKSKIHPILLYKKRKTFVDKVKDELMVTAKKNKAYQVYDESIMQQS